MAAGRHRAPDAPGDTTTSRGEPRRGPKPGEKPRRKPAYKRSPVEVFTGPHPPLRAPTRETPTVTAPRAKAPKVTKPARAGRALDAAHAYASRQAVRATGARPSVTGRAVSGTAAGAATGAALGSVVPGVGTAAGAGVGAVVGGAGGAVGGAKAKKAYNKALKADSAGPRRLLLAEFAICATVTALSPLTDAKRSEKPGDWMKRMTAVFGLFFILGLVSSGGRGAAKVAAGFGGLITLVLVTSQRDLFVKLAEIFASGSKPLTTSGPIGHEAPFTPTGG